MLVESRMAEVAGIPQRTIAELRGYFLKKDADWRVVDKRVVIEEAAARRLLRALEVPDGSMDEILEKTRGGLAGVAGNVPVEPPHAVEAIGVEKTAKVARVFPNPTRLSAYLGDEVPEKFRRIIVRVKSNLNFKVGMEIPVRRTAYDLWECTRPVPRFPGKW